MTQNIVILGTAVLWKKKNYYADKFHLWMWWRWWLWWSIRKKRVEASLERGAVSLAGHRRGRFGQTTENNGVAEGKMKTEAEKRSSWTLNESLFANYETKDARDSGVIQQTALGDRLGTIERKIYKAKPSVHFYSKFNLINQWGNVQREEREFWNWALFASYEK